MSAALVDASDGASDADSPRGSSTLSDDDVGSPSRHPRALSFPRAGADAVEALEAVEEAQRASTSSPVTADQDVEELLLLFAHERETTLERLRAARAVVHEVSTSMSEWQRRARRHLRDRRLRRIRRAAFDAWRARAACDPRRRHVLRECARACGCARDSVASSADGATSRDEPAATRPPSVAPSRVATTSRAHARSARGPPSRGSTTTTRDSTSSSPTSADASNAASFATRAVDGATIFDARETTRVATSPRTRPFDAPRADASTARC